MTAVPLRVESDILQKELRACQRHAERIESILKKMDGRWPITHEDFEKCSSGDIEGFDSLVLRFAKLQDTLGRKVFKYVLILVGEDVERKTPLDQVHILDKWGILNTHEWLQLREVRNRLAHDYDIEPELFLDELNNVAESSRVLLQIYRQVAQKAYEVLRSLNEPTTASIS